MDMDSENSYMQPLAVLWRNIGLKITIMLKDGCLYTGVLENVSENMNMLLEDVVEEYNGKKIRYGRALLRGNNILYIKLSRF